MRLLTEGGRAGRWSRRLPRGGLGLSSSAARGRGRGRVVTRRVAAWPGAVAAAVVAWLVARLRRWPPRRARPRTAATRAAPARARAWSATRCSPCSAVVAIGLGSVLATLVYVRLTGARDGGLTTRDRDHRPIGKNCELGRLGSSTSHFLHEPCRPPSRPTHRRDPVGHQGRQAARRAPEHDPGVERRRPAALLPDQPARRPALPARRPPALPGRRRDRRRPTAPTPAQPAVGRPPQRRRRRGRPVRAADAHGVERRRPTRSTPSAIGSTSPSPRRSTRLINRLRGRRRGARRRGRDALRDAYGHHLVAVWEARGDRLAPRAVASAEAGPPRLVDLPRRFGILGRALELAAGARPDRRADRCPASCSAATPTTPLAVLPDDRPELAVAIPGARRPVGRPARRRRGRRARSVRATSTSPRSPRTRSGAIVSGAQRADEVAHLLHRAEALRRVAERHRQPARPRSDPVRPGRPRDGPVRGRSGRRLPPASRRPGRGRGQPRPVGGVPRQRPRLPGRGRCPAAAVGRAPAAVRGRLPQRPTRRGRPGGRRPGGLRHAVHGAARSTARELLGLLNVYHDRPHHWTDDELDTIGALATQASVAIRAAQDFERMATWAAQLQSIQQLGARLSRLSSVARDRPVDRDRAAPAHRLPQRPGLPARRRRPHPGRDAGPGRRVRRRDARPAAGRDRRGHHRLGRGAPRRPEPPRRRRRPAGEHDPRAPRTTSTSRCSWRRWCSTTRCLGVLVLSKLGLHQFTDDDLRLLVIYASFAAQAMANADTTERLREQSRRSSGSSRGQRELLQITESILTTLDARGRPREHHRPARPADRLRQHRDRGRRSGDRAADAADRARRPRRLLPRAVGARRDRRRDLGRRAQRAGLHRRRARTTRGSTTSATRRRRSTAA